VMKSPSVKRDSRRGRRVVVVVGSSEDIVVFSASSVVVCEMMFSAGLRRREFCSRCEGVRYVSRAMLVFDLSFARVAMSD
jgi:hypothetical protein